MPELDAFETRFAADYRRYLDEAPTAVDAAAVVRTVIAAPPRARWDAWRMALRPAPALVWLAILALLMAALGAALFVGSQLERKAPVVLPPIGTTYACPPGSQPDAPGPVAQARPPQTPRASAFDRRAGRIVLVAPTPAGEAAGVATWTFDVCTNTWTRMHPDREPPSLETRLVYDVDSDLTIGVFAEPPAVVLGENRVIEPRASRRVWAYDLQADAWIKKGVASEATLWAYDPDSGLVDATRDSDLTDLWAYDVETDTWTPIHQANAGPAPMPIAYDASVDRMVGYTNPGSNETWLLDLKAGRWSKSDALTPHVLDWLAPAAIAYDEAAKRTVVGGNVALAAYDATADRWETIELPGADYPNPDAWHGVSMVDDPVNERLVLFPDTWGQRTGATDAGVVAFDLVTHGWTVLLEPGTAEQPAVPPPNPAPSAPPAPTP